MSGRRSPPPLWTSIEECSDDAALAAWIAAEYPAAADFAPAARREFLKLMAASFALAGLTGCEKSPFVAALPYVDQPEAAVLGKPRYYATAVTLDGYAQPVLATTHAGRPTKLDGLPEHPATQGRSDAFMQAAVLALYDPDRSRMPYRASEPASWGDVEQHIADLRERWQANGGDGLCLLTGCITSPTLVRQLDALRTQFPKARLFVHEPAGEIERAALMQIVYGRPLDLHYRLEACDVVVSLDDDVLGPGPRQLSHALGWSRARRRNGDMPDLRLYCAESVPGATGALAARRLAADASRMAALAAALAKQVGLDGASDDGLSAREQRWVSEAAARLRAATGRALVLCGLSAGETAAWWTARINARLDAHGRTLFLTAPIAERRPDTGTLADLAAALNAGTVDTLAILDSNPVYTAPGALEFATALTRARATLHLGLHRDETGSRCAWHLPLAHPLESWSDARAIDGTATIIQPTVTPFYAVRSAHQVLAMMLGETDISPDRAVRDTWRLRFADAFEAHWRQALHDGFVDGAATTITATPGATPPPASAGNDNGDGELDVVFRPDPSVWDGRFSNVGWLQELPKPLTTLTWGNAIAISPVLARRHALANGDRVTLTIDGRSIEGPVWIMPGQADNTAALFLGYGRPRAGRVGDALGYNAYAVRPVAAPWHARGRLEKRDGRETLAVTQLHHRLDGFDFVREVDARAPSLPPPKAQPSLYAPQPSAKNAWGMVIDLDSCIGCNACVAACTAENNVPVVGKDQVIAGREMHWLRIARYYSGPVEEPRSFFQPVPCMHCEDAPCEMGCPVHATTHSPEGLNQMVYNRCIGTRTCSSYCPYKVRRFNFYDYRNAPEAPENAAHNPDVTVRSRGVMEKCTYCTQRIEAAHAAADKDNRDLRDGDVVTACQSACPTNAIVFGDINDPASQVSKLRRSGRHYVLLEDQGTRPRTTYLARWKDSAEDGDG